jgi:hypothetical protein
MRLNFFRTLAISVVAGLALGTVFAAPAGDRLTIPVGFEHWYLVNSMVVTKDSPLFDAIGGLHHVRQCPWIAAAEEGRFSAVS